MSESEWTEMVEDAIQKMVMRGIKASELVIISHEEPEIPRGERTDDTIYQGIPWVVDDRAEPGQILVMQRRDFDRIVDKWGAP